MSPAHTLTSPQKTRVRGFGRCPSGRLSRPGPHSPGFTPGLRASSYKTASGRRKWLNRDPIADQGAVLSLSHRYGKFVRRAGDKAGPNLYLFVSNDPPTKSDPDGREVLNYGCSGGTPTCWSPLQKGPPPPQPDPCTSRGGHYEPYWKIMGYSDLNSCATAEWQLIRDTVAGGLGAVGGTICGGGYGGIAGGVGGTLLIPVAICSQQICVFN